MKGNTIITEREHDGVRILYVEPGTGLHEILVYGAQRQDEWRSVDICWELYHFDFTTLNAAEMRKIASFMKSKVTREVGRKTAYVVESDLGFGMMRMLELVIPPDLPIILRAFRSTDEAISWLTTATERIKPKQESQ